MYLSMRKLLVTFFLFSAVLLPSFAPAQAQFDESIRKLDKAVGPDSKTKLAKDLPDVISTIVSAVLGVLGTIFFVLVVYAGVKWMLARGDEGEIEKSKEIIKAAVIGLVVTLAAYALTYFIGSKFGGTGAPTPAAPPAAPAP